MPEEKEKENKPAPPKKKQSKTFVNIFKMKRIPIVEVDINLGVTMPTGLDIKALKEKLGIGNNEAILSGRELISVAGETISFTKNTGLENLEPIMLDLSGFKAMYVPNGIKNTETLIQTYKRIFPFIKIGKSIDTFLPVCNEDDNKPNEKLMKPLIKSLEFRLNNLRTAIIAQRSLPSDSVNLRNKLAQFNTLDELITSFNYNMKNGICMKKEEEEQDAAPEVDEDISLLLQQFAFLLLLRKEDRSIDKNNIVKKFKEQFTLKLEKYPGMKQTIKEFLDITSQKTQVGGHNKISLLEDQIDTLDNELKELSNRIQVIEVKDTPTKKEKRELVKQQKELNSLFKKRVALEESLSEAETSREYTVEPTQLPDLVDMIYPELQNSKFLKFEKELNEKLHN